MSQNTPQDLDAVIDQLYGILAQQEENLRNNPECTGTKNAVAGVKRAITKVEMAKEKTIKALSKAGL